MISLDTEDTGGDFFHGAAPFYVSTCSEDEKVTSWEWDVDPYTRKPVIPASDLQEVYELVRQQDGVVLHNARFDITALTVAAFREVQGPIAPLEWPWEKTYCTLLAGHLLGTNLPKNLTDMVMQYLGEDILPHEENLEIVVKECRKYCHKHLPEWRLAKEGDPLLPSIKKATSKGKHGIKNDEDKVWKYDTWLPRALVKYLWEQSEAGIAWEKSNKRRIAIQECRKLEGWEYRPPETQAGDDPGHSWWTALQRYANADAEVTLYLWKAVERTIRERKLWKIYDHRRKLLPVSQRLECQGVPLSRVRLDELYSQYQQDEQKAAETCSRIAKSYHWNLEMPKGASVNDSLRTLCFDILKLEPVRNPKAKTDAPSLDSKTAIPHYLRTLDKDSKPWQFVRSFADKREVSTALTFLNLYRRFWIPSGTGSDGAALMPPMDREAYEWLKLHFNLNPCGSDHLRWSCKPAGQNISKKPKFNLRHVFGPEPGREHWSLDAKNIERRIPVYEARQQEIIDLFERPDDPPYFGSEHLFVAHVIYKKEFEECRDELGRIDGRIFKKRYAATLYQWTKNFNFALQYQAGKRTADATSRVPGSFEMIKARLDKLEALNQKCMKFARKYGYIETIPDRTVDPERGYPILCSRNEWGAILGTVPLNYHVSGTAMQWMNQSMIRCQEQIDEWNRKEGKDTYKMIMQVHDELIFDFPKAVHPKKHPKASNLARVRVLQKLMASNGDNLVTAIPTPTGIEYHEHSWAEGITIA